MKTYHTTAKQLTATYKEWAANPEMTMQADWATTWTHEDFLKWFRSCLNAKINREDIRNTWRKCQPDYQRDLQHDARIIKQYYAFRVRCSGRNLLNTKEMQTRYPELNNTMDW